jgi:hypothetical protein
MRKTKKVIDLLSIRKMIKGTRKNFLDKFGSIPDMVDADETLLMARVNAKVMAILKCFQDEKVIDAYVHEYKSIFGNSFSLHKNGCNTNVIIATNGRKIIFRTRYFENYFGVEESPYNIYNLKDDYADDVVDDVDDFNWFHFSEELIDFIHANMYHRKKAIDVKLFGKSH